MLCIFCVSVATSKRGIAAEESSVRYYMGEAVNTGKDNGYSGKKEIKKDDPHFGWKLGEFYVEGFTRYEMNEDGNPVFLKNVGDEVVLWFDLLQDINKLNGIKDLYINEDKDGYDEKFDIKQTNLKKGALIVRYTDYQNKVGEPQIYTNYLLAKKAEDADTEVLLCEEGDYEVSLLYEIKDDGFLFFNSYTNYRIDFKFSVRNGNTMFFPFDMESGAELANNSFTEKGFRLDLAQSKYLQIDISREILSDNGEGLVEDIRFNRPAKDGEEYTEEGIYTIVAKNQYTGAVTEKKIYVGNNSVLKAHVVTGLTINEINEQVSHGASIDEMGNVVMLSVETDTDIAGKSKVQKEAKGKLMIYIVITGVALVTVLSICVILYTSKRKNKR